MNPKTLQGAEARGERPQTELLQQRKPAVPFVLIPRPGRNPLQAKCTLVGDPQRLAGISLAPPSAVVGASKKCLPQFPPKLSKPWLRPGTSAGGWMPSLKGPSCPCWAEELIRFVSPGARTPTLALGEDFNRLQRFGTTGTFLLRVQNGTLGRRCPQNARGAT